MHVRTESRVRAGFGRWLLQKKYLGTEFSGGITRMHPD